MDPQNNLKHRHTGFSPLNSSGSHSLPKYKSYIPMPTAKIARENLASNRRFRSTEDKESLEDLAPVRCIRSGSYSVGWKS